MSANHDVIMFRKERKTIKDVLTVWEASSAHKSSKNHKLKPRGEKRDKTKTDKSRAMSIKKRNSHMKCQYGEC